MEIVHVFKKKNAYAFLGNIAILGSSLQMEYLTFDFMVNKLLYDI